MSSITKSTQQHSSETTTKKKFGKNLNKLTKPPAPVASSPPKANASSRNGLLLLSTKRASSNVAAAASSGGILSNKPSQVSSKPLPVLGLQYESNTSTHDALLGAVVGASRAESQQQPDAWGVADKQQKDEANENLNETTANDEVRPSPPDPQTPPRDQSNHQPEADNNNSSSIVADLPSSNWDEYGGRNVSPEKMETAALYSDEGQDVQGTYMARRARERSDQRRSEEESRISQQKERANQRLRELDQKIAGRTTFEGDGGSDDLKNFALEKLGYEEGGPEETNMHHPQSLSDRPQQRTLFDPNRPSNSAVGGGGGCTARNDQRPRSNSGDRNGRMMMNTQDSRQPMIQLASYEDRDRGSSAGPRMLFDPKSGSMVAVREDATTSGRGRKERGKKGRNAREKDAKVDNRHDNEGPKGGKKGKARRDENAAQPRGKVSPAESSPATKADSKKGRVSTERRLPRTCGVLYSRDNKGHYVSVDGSDGDLGYGAHSVPGGKTRNPEAFSRYNNEKKQPIHEEPKPYEKPRPEITLSYKDTLLHDVATPEVTLQTGFSVPEPEPVLDWVKPNEKITLMTGIDDSPSLQATAKEWAPSHAALTAAAAAAAGRQSGQPNTGEGWEEDHEEDEDDHAPLGLGFDPTLNMDSVMQSPSAEPTSHLNAVDFAALSLEPAMQATAQSTHSIFAFESGTTWGSSSNAAGATHDLSGGTWGASHAAATGPATAGGGGVVGMNNWGMIPTSSSSSSTNAFSNNTDSSGQPAVSASFLLSSSNTWGSGVSGLSGNALGGSSVMNGEHHTGSSTGD